MFTRLKFNDLQLPNQLKNVKTKIGDNR